MSGRGRIFHFAWRYPPCYCSPTGSARNLALTEGLQRAGWEVTVFAGRPIDSPCDCWTTGEARAVSEAGARIVYVESSDRAALRRHRAHRSSSAADRAIRAASAAQTLAVDTTTDYVARAAEAAVQRARGQHPDVVLHSGRPTWGITSAVALAHALKARSVIHLHDSIVRMAGDRTHRLLRAPATARALLALHHADLVTSISPEDATRDERFARRPIEVLEGGFDEAHWEDIERAVPGTRAVDVLDDAAERAFRVVYTGRLYDFQDPDVLLGALREASDRLAARSGGSPLLLYVFGPEKTMWEEARARFGVSSIVRMPGEVDRDRASLVLTKAQLAILLGRRDGGAGNYGQKLFDYLASGVPIMFCPADPSDSGAMKIAQSGRGLSTRSTSDAAAYLLALVEQWERSGRPDPDPLRIPAIRSSPYAFSRRVEELDAMLQRLVGEQPVGAR